MTIYNTIKKAVVYPLVGLVGIVSGCGFGQPGWRTLQQEFRDSLDGKISELIENVSCYGEAEIPEGKDWRWNRSHAEHMAKLDFYYGCNDGEFAETTTLFDSLEGKVYVISNSSSEAGN